MNKEKNNNNDPRRLHPKGYFYREKPDAQEVDQILPHPAVRDIVLILAMITAWILVGIFLFQNYKSNKNVSSLPDQSTVQKKTTTNNLRLPHIEEMDDLEDITILDVENEPVVEYNQAESGETLITNPPSNIEYTHTLSESAE